MSVYDYNTDPASNGTISGINIAEGCPAGSLNNAQRQMMADIAAFVANALVGQLSATSTIRRDAQFYFDLITGGDPTVNYNPGAYDRFSRSGNYLITVISNVERFRLDPGGATISGGLSVSGSATVNGSTVWTQGSLTNLNQLANGPGYLAGISSSNVTGALGYTPANAAGQTFTGDIKRDANFYMGFTGASPQLVFDNTDGFVFDRTNNKLTFFINSAAVWSVDSAGTMRVSGNIIGNTTP